MSLIDNLIQKLWTKLQELIDQYSDFIRKPDGLVAVNIAMRKLLDGLLGELKDMIRANLSSVLAAGSDALMSKIFTDPHNITDDQITEYVRRSKPLRGIREYASSSYNEDIIGDIVLACTDENYYRDRAKELSKKLALPDRELGADDFINAVSETSDFDDRVSGFSRKIQNAASLLEDVEGVLPWVFTVYSIILGVKEWLDKTEHPSKYLGKSISRYLRIVSALMQSSVQKEMDRIKTIPSNIEDTTNSAIGRISSSANSIKDLIAKIKAVDAAIAGTLLAYFIYQNNRQTLAEISREEFSKSIAGSLCPSVELETPQNENTLIDPSIFSQINFSIDPQSFACPVSLDNVPSPIEPLEEKLSSFSCPVPQMTVAQTTLGNYLAPLQTLSQKALYVDLRPETGDPKLSKSWTPLVTRGDLIEPGTPVFSTPEMANPVLSSIAGRVHKITPDKREIEIQEVKPQEILPIEKDIKELQNLYMDKTHTDLFLKDWDIRLLYPRMIALSPLLDASAASGTYGNIVYPVSVKKRWIKSKERRDRADDTYNKKGQDLTSKDRVQSAAENGNTDKIVNDFENLQKGFYRELEDIEKKYLNDSRVTQGKKSEVVLFPWYMQVYTELLEAKDNTQTIEYKMQTPPEERGATDNPYLLDLIKRVNEFLVQRAFIDNYSTEEIEETINSLGEELDRGQSLPYRAGKKISYVEVLKETYEREVKDGNSQEKSLRVTSSTVSRWASERKGLPSSEKNNLRELIYGYWTFLQTFSIQKDKEYETDETSAEATLREAQILSEIFNKSWRNRTEIPKDIERINAKIDDQSGSYLPESSIERDGETYRLYGLDSRTCGPSTSEPKGLNSSNGIDLGDIRYWIKWCSYATLASVLALPANWGTGVPPPIGPISIPTIYIPFKAFTLPWGVIVFGLSLTGIYPFPWVMVGNLSYSPHVPLVDPASILRREVESIKTELIEKLKKYRRETLREAYRKALRDLDHWESLVDKISENSRKLRENKPRRDRTLQEEGESVASGLFSQAEKKKAYIERLSAWNIRRVSLNEELSVAKARRYSAGLKAKILYDATRDLPLPDENTAPEIISLKETEKSIDKIFAKLDKAISSIDPFIGSLPISTAPGSSSFLFTLKNPKPVSEIEDGLEDPINEGLLEEITLPFRHNKSSLMLAGYSNNLRSRLPGGKAYTDVLSASKWLLVPEDAFPRYGDLKPSYLPWFGKFLLTKFAPAGGAQYGFPGFPKYPSG